MSISDKYVMKIENLLLLLLLKMENASVKEKENEKMRIWRKRWAKSGPKVQPTFSGNSGILFPILSRSFIF